MGRKKTPQEENETQQKLIKATLETVAEKGIDGVTARAVADKAGVNQALVFYYFGSVTNLLIESVKDMSSARYLTYETELSKGKTIQELFSIFMRVFNDDRETASFQVLSQFVSASKNSDEISKAIEPIFTKWIDLTKNSLERVLSDVQLPENISFDNIAMAIMSALLGVQFLAMVPEYEDRVSGMISNVGSIAPLLGLLPTLLQSFTSLNLSKGE